MESLTLQERRVVALKGRAWPCEPGHVVLRRVLRGGGRADPMLFNISKGLVGGGCRRRAPYRPDAYRGRQAGALLDFCATCSGFSINPSCNARPPTGNGRRPPAAGRVGTC